MTTPLAEAIRVLKAGTGLPTSSKVPNDKERWPGTGRPPSFLKVVRAGGQRTRAVDHMLLIVECWAPDGPAAEQLAIKVNDILAAAPYTSEAIILWGDGDRGVTIADNPDPDITTQHRWTVTGPLHCLTF